MKKSKLLRLALSVSLVFCLNQINAQITAEQAIELMGRGINLGNTLDAPTEGAWASQAQEYYFDMYADAGFKTVRIPITWGAHLGTTEPFTINADFLTRVEEIVDWGLNREMYVIINAHHDSWIKDDYAGQKARFDSLWSQISMRFKDKSEHLFFEILNEPHGAITVAQVDELNARVLGIIRQNNPTRVVVYSGAGWANSPDLLNAAIPNTDDPYLMGYYHSYDPWTFAGESQGTWGSASDVQAMVSKMDDVKTWSEQQNIPILVGEFGAMFDCDFNSRMLYYATYVENLLAHQFAFTVWDDDGWFQILQRDDSTWNEIKDILIYTSDSSITGLNTEVVDDTALQVSWSSRANPDLIEKVLIEKRTLSTEYSVVAEFGAVSGTTFIDRAIPVGETTVYRIVDVYENKTIPSYPISYLRVSTEREPFLGSPITIPGTIEAEDFDKGGEMLTYHDVDVSNKGGAYRLSEGVDIEARIDGFHVGYVEAGEWLEYTIDVAKTATYKFTAYLASLDGGGTMQLQFSNVNSPSITVPKSGDWTTLQPVSVNVDLEQGEQVVRLNIESLPSYNIDKIVVEEYTGIESAERAAVKIMPNPVFNELYVTLNAESDFSFAIFNSNGKLLIQNKVNELNAIVDVSKLKSGLYFIQLQSETMSYSSKFVKQ
jgi:aryl-phospho-beta-D-glucosidase BglC (GH1 family)